MFASSGPRHSEMLGLELRGIDLDRMLKPRKTSNPSKHVWVSFYDEEAKRDLEKYLSDRESQEPRLSPISKRQVLRIFKKASQISGVKVAPQTLRDWFCVEMGALAVPDRYVDAFCGRVPKSVLARHYKDFSPEKLKRVYVRAQLKVLN